MKSTIALLLVASATLAATLSHPHATPSHTEGSEVAPAIDTTFLAHWTATTVISEAQATQVGLKRLFTANAIDAATAQRMKGKSYRTDCRIPLTDLRLLHVAHRNANGQTQLGEIVCHKRIAEKLLRIFSQLYQANYRIERIRLIDDYDADDERAMTDNNTSCFCYREVAGSQKLSKHSQGLAVDINTLYNPCVANRQGRQTVQPQAGRPYAFRRDQRQDIPYKIDHNDLAYKLFRAEGFTWGGDWRTVKDYQHFEYN